MKTAIRKCRGCGAEETLASPFVDGECYGCIRKQQPLEPSFNWGPAPPVPAPEAEREPAKPWTGPQFIGFSGLLCVIAVVTVVFGGAIDDMTAVSSGSEFGGNEWTIAAMFLASILSFWATVCLFVGIIRWAVRP